ncbi:hypothetical protein GW17_00028574 [Ensete ventricosum]|nr:hypothetical protein GW17_00028574 [Ensete ventricosum]
MLWAYVIDIVGLDRNNIVSVGKWGTKTVGSGNDVKQGQQEAREQQGRKMWQQGWQGWLGSTGGSRNNSTGSAGYGWQRRKEEGSDSREWLVMAAGGGRRQET